MGHDIYTKKFEFKERTFGTVFISIYPEMDILDYMMYSPRTVFFENVGDGKEGVRYSEGEKWEELIEILNKEYGLEKGSGGVFYRDGIDDREEIIRLLAFSESYMEQGMGMWGNGEAYDFHGGEGLLVEIEEFMEGVREKTESLITDLEHDIGKEGIITTMERIGYLYGGYVGEESVESAM